MKLTLENGNHDSHDVIKKPKEKLILEEFADEYFDFAILESGKESYIQCRIIEDTGRCLLEHRDGSADRHYQTEKTVSLDRAISAFIWYLRGDESWRSEFVWERIVV